MNLFKKLREPAVSYYNVDIRKCLSRRGPHQRGNLARFNCPHCKTGIAFLDLNDKAKCFLCGLEMERTGTFTIKCKK